MATIARGLDQSQRFLSHDLGTELPEMERNERPLPNRVSKLLSHGSQFPTGSCLKGHPGPRCLTFPPFPSKGLHWWRSLEKGASDQSRGHSRKRPDERSEHHAGALSCFLGASLEAQMVKNLPAEQETWVPPLGQEDPLEKETATHSGVLAWEAPRTEEPGGL